MERKAESNFYEFLMKYWIILNEKNIQDAGNKTLDAEHKTLDAWSKTLSDCKMYLYLSDNCLLLKKAHDYTYSYCWNKKDFRV